MLQPPLYLRLTNFETREKFNFLLVNCHCFSEHKDGYTLITTFHATSMGVATLNLKVLETEQVIYMKMEKLVKQFYKLSASQAKRLMQDDTETWRKEGEGYDDDDEPLPGESFFA